MIRVYLDWNVFSRLEHNDDIHKKLTSILNDDSKYIIPYSSAHLKDLYRSYKKVGLNGIEGHLEKIQKFSKSLFLVYNTKDILEFQILEAKESMQQYINAYDKDDSFNFNLDHMMEGMKPFDSILKPLLNIQFPNLIQSENKEIKQEIKRTKNSEFLNHFFGTKETISLKDMMQNLMTVSSTLYEDDYYSNLRDEFQREVKVSGRINDNRFNPIETLDKNAQKLQKENFMELFESMLIGESKKSLFNKIIEMVRQLDFHGFYPDIIKKGHHLDNIQTDYEHIAYATSCDVFIVSDKNTRKKAALTFELLELNVLVFTPKEYIDFVERNLFEIKDGQSLIDYMFCLKSLEPTSEIDDMRVYYIPSLVLYYFDLASYSIHNPKSVTLQKIHNPNKVGVLAKEAEYLIKQLNLFYGIPINEFGNLYEGSYLIAWLTKELVLIKFQLISGNLKLEILQCYKMTKYDMFKNKFKRIIRMFSKK